MFNGHHSLNQDSPLKSREEMEAAHDLLNSIYEAPEMHGALSEQDMLMVQACRDVLCWVLSHEDNDSFSSNIDQLETMMRGFGYAPQEYDN